jgi:hypothetical protein
LKSNLEAFLGSRIDSLISDLELFAFLGTHEEFEDEIKKMEVAWMVVSLLLMLQWATIN